MKELEKKLKELQSRGYENIGITQVLNWMAEIKRDSRSKRLSKKSDGRTIIKPTNFAVYDNDGETLDRYTIIDLNTKRKGLHNYFYDAIGASETGAGFYAHIECIKGSHLGKLISFSDLSPELQKMILSEY